jgi:hypothetical protein
MEDLIIKFTELSLSPLTKQEKLLKHLEYIEKHCQGRKARRKWKKEITKEECNVEYFNNIVGNVFKKSADIVLDSNPSCRTVIKSIPLNNKEWKLEQDVIYLIIRNGCVMKIGGTRTGMNKRWYSYKCGHCVPERMMKNGEMYPGKMSVTNAYLYHTIEDDLLKGNTWEFWSWTLPAVKVSIDIFGSTVDVEAQVYHAYERRCIELFKQKYNRLPQLCN